MAKRKTGMSPHKMPKPPKKTAKRRAVKMEMLAKKAAKKKK